MKLAGGDVIVWLIVAIVVAISKGLKKAANPISSDEDGTAPARPIERPLVVRPPINQPAQQNLPPIVRPTNTEVRPEPPRDLREFIERLRRPPQPPPAPPVVKKLVPSAPPKPAAVPEPIEAASQEAVKPAVPTAPTPVPTNFSSQWTATLRDRKNIRNVIIAMEILGPPRGA